MLNIPRGGGIGVRVEVYYLPGWWVGGGWCDIYEINAILKSVVVEVEV